MEWFFGPKGLRFSEIGCRPPGVGQWDSYCAGNEIDLYREWALAVCHGRHRPAGRRGATPAASSRSAPTATAGSPATRGPTRSSTSYRDTGGRQPLPRRPARRRSRWRRATWPTPGCGCGIPTTTSSARDPERDRRAGAGPGALRIMLVGLGRPVRLSRQEIHEQLTGRSGHDAQGARRRTSWRSGCCSRSTAMAVTLVRGNDTDPATLDHHKTSTISESRVLNDLYDGLVTQDAAGNVIPGAAESWEISEDGTTYTFHMRDGRQVVERRSGDLRRLPLRLPADHGPGDGGGYASILFPIQNAEAVNKGEMAARGARRRGARPADPRLHPQRADALLPAAPDPPDRQAAAPGRASRSSATSSPSPATS